MSGSSPAGLVLGGRRDGQPGPRDLSDFPLVCGAPAPNAASANGQLQNGTQVVARKQPFTICSLISPSIRAIVGTSQDGSCPGIERGKSHPAEVGQRCVPLPPVTVPHRTISQSVICHGGTGPVHWDPDGPSDLISSCAKRGLVELCTALLVYS